MRAPALCGIYVHVARSAWHAHVRTYATPCPSPCLILALALTFPQSLPCLYTQLHHPCPRPRLRNYCSSEVLQTYVCRLLVCRAIRLSVAGCPGARCGVPVDLHVTMEEPGCTDGRVRGRATNPRTKNSCGPGARQTGRIQNSA